ncbi:MAG: hypothetical protein ACTSW4_05910 [Candidatus Ranarchaeia archaeon]
MPLEHVGEIIRGSLNLLVGALISKEVARDLQEVKFGDFLSIQTKNSLIVGVAGFLQFETFGQIQPIGLPPDQRNEILPDLEDVVYANTLKVVTIPVLGYIEGENVYQEIPPQLPDIHDPIMVMTEDQIRKFHETPNGIRLSYLSRLCENDIRYQADLIGRVFRRLEALMQLEITCFLSQLQTSYEEATGDPMPSYFAAKLQRAIAAKR